MARGRFWLTAALGFIEAMIFALVTANVIADLSNLLVLFAYCAGFSLGIYVGMEIEARFVTSWDSDPAHVEALAEAIRRL